MQHMTNAILERMQGGQPALGLTVRLTRSGEIVRVARASGHHFVRIDLQHALFDSETIGHIAQTAVGSGTPLVVRVRGVDDPQVPALLDAGVEGIVFPDVATREEAERCVRATRFPPLGERSYGGGYPRFDYRSVPAAEAMPALEALVVCMLETPAAVEQVDEIASVPGIDVVHLGLNDFLASMGTPGQIDHPAADEAIGRIIDAATANNRFAGCGGSPTVAHQRAVIARGGKFMTTRNDINFLADGAAAWVKAVTA
jgi:2-keto-3-deoxy-L-rhamnonate aldolase RhmA